MPPFADWICLAVKAAPASAENDAASFASDGFYAQPSVILKISEKESAASLSEERLPASVFLSIDENLAVLGKDGETLGNFSEIYESQIKGKAMPVVCPDTSAAFDAFAAYASGKNITDLAIASESVAVLSKVKSELSARAYYIALASSTDDCLREIGKANAVGAQVLIFSAEETNAEYIRFIQARFKCVWVDTDGSAEQIADAVGQGAYGIIAPDAAKVFEVYGKIGSAKEKNYILSRAPYIAAHRGDTTVHSENTVGAIEDAARIGATHVEIDIRLTADEQIVLLHDDDIRYALRDDAGNPAAGYVSKLTLAQLKSYTMSDGVSKIPTLDEVFEAVNRDGVGDMVLIIEFKGQEAKLVDLFRQKVAEYGMAGRITVISFYPAQLVRVAEQLPSVPASLLLYTDGANAATSQAYSNGSGIDMQFNGGRRSAGILRGGIDGERLRGYFQNLRRQGLFPLAVDVRDGYDARGPSQRRDGDHHQRRRDNGKPCGETLPAKDVRSKKSACGRRKDFGKGKDVCGRGKDGRGESGLAGKAGNGRHGGTCLRIGARYLPDQRKRKIYGERRQRLRFVGGRAFVGRSRRRGGFAALVSKRRK